MNIRILRPLLFLGFLFVYSFSFSQDRCGTVEYTQKLKHPENETQFEHWLQQRILTQRPGRSQRQQAGPYEVPVVVHVIHNGEPEGEGANIPDAQILSQINVLNEDFNRLNADATETPSEFAAVAGSMNIQFVLAKQNPEGLATSGIVRVDGNKGGWVMADNYALKEKSYWPSEEYLNIWVCNLTDYLGYTQFPISTLPGLEGPDNASTDGIVVWHGAFGSIDDGAFDLDPAYNKGRTLTHEMGHFFGLRHIWGDDTATCSGTDYVDDTPNQSDSSANCPTHPREDDCSEAIMFQNFLDYTDDICMNLFTQGQVTRMSFVLENSPRRASLLNSPGLHDPVPVANDLGLRAILSPQSTSCSSTIIPEVEVRNYGSNTVTSARIRLDVNDITVETKDVVLDLGNLESSTIAFNPVAVSPGSSTFVFEIELTNGAADGQVNNNSLFTPVFVSETTTVPFAENFDVLPGTWEIQNPDQQFTWELAEAPKETSANKALLLNFFDYEDSFAEIDIFLSPVFDLSSVPVASLSFDVAYARYQSSNDQLKVIVLTNCQPLSEGTILYDKTGNELATAPATTSFFSPQDESEWRKEVNVLNPFIGETYVQLAFVGINDWGNNLYLDNISLTTSIVEDVALKEMINPGPVTCNLSSTPKIVVQNVGNININDFKVIYSVNGGDTETFDVSDAGLEDIGETQVVLPPVLFDEGVNRLSVTITEPNGIPDPTPENNTKEFTVVVNQASGRIPLRENFDQLFEDQWISHNPSGGMNWTTASTNFSTSVSFNAYDNTVTGDSAWMVSPVLDFSGATTASMVFDVSYRRRAERLDHLKVVGSSDCGNSYETISEIPLSPFSSHALSWTPQDESGWRENFFVNLNAFAGQEQVRIAFVATNENGNNIFLDNIEFFVTDKPDTIEITESYSLYGYNETDPAQSGLKITFNLSERQNVHYAVVDMMGKSHAQGILTDVLNQTYPLELNQTLSSGIYIVRLRMGNRYYTNRILISR